MYGSRYQESVITAPLVSTILPAYNGANYLAEAIESALAQTYAAQEIIVIDDSSSDSTPEIIRQFNHRVQYCRQDHGGTAAARNRGTGLATGDFFAFLDQDDLWAKEKLDLQVTAFRDNPELDIVFGHLQQFSSPDAGQEWASRIYCAPDPIPGILTTTMMVSRKAFFCVGNFDTQWQLGEWSNWYIRAIEAGLKILVLPEVLAKRRLHASNKGLTQREHITEYPQLLKASLDRRRAKATGQ